MSMRNLNLILIALWLTTCFATAFADTVIPGGYIEADETWTQAGSPYLVQGDVWVRGAANPRLTIEPGVTVILSGGVFLSIGYSSNSPGELYAAGTDVDPIIFTSQNGSPGGWDGLYFADASDYNGAISTLEYCQIENAGTYGVYLFATSQPALIDHCSFNNASGNGVGFERCYGQLPVITNSTISGNGGWPVVLVGSALPEISSTVITDNGYTEFKFSGNIYSDMTLDLSSYPWEVIIHGAITIYDSTLPTLTIPAGTTLQFATNSSLNIGYSWNGPGELQAIGTESEPIIFTSQNGSPGGWNGLYFADASDYNGAVSTMEYCQVENAGTYGVRLFATTQPALLDHCTISNASGSGVAYERCYDQLPHITNSTISGNGGWPVVLVGSALPSISSTVMIDNGYTEFKFSGNIYGDMTLDLSSYPWEVIIHGAITIYDSTLPTLTIPAGTTLQFATNSSLNIGYSWNSPGELQALGTEMEPIVFTSQDGLPGGWNGLYFADASDYNGAVSTMEYCQVVNAGTYGVRFYATTQPALLDNCTFSNASGSGVAYERCYDQLPVITNSTISGNGQWPVVLIGSALPSISSTVMVDNGYTEFNFTGNIYGDMTLDLNSYPWEVIIHGAITIYDSTLPTLTVPAGTTLQFATNSSLNIGYSWNSPGELQALGTEMEPIVFTSQDGLPGGWNGLYFADASDYNGAVSTMEYCQVVNAGTYGVRFYATTQPALLDNCTFSNASGSGVAYERCYDQFPVITNSTISDNGQWPVVVIGSELPEINSTTVSGNGYDEFSYTGRVFEDVTLDLANYPWEVVFNSSTWVYNSTIPTVTIPPGTTLQFGSGASLNIAYSWNSPGELNAVGTAAEPITFTSQNGEIGGWNGVTFQNSSDYNGAVSMLTNCLVEKASQSNLACYDTSQPSLDSCVVRFGLNDGMFIENSTPTVVRTMFLANGRYGVSHTGTSAITIGDSDEAACVFEGNGVYAIYNNSTADVMARYNFWDYVTQGEIDGTIHDYWDDSALGEVVYLPFSCDGMDLHLRMQEEQIHLSWCPLPDAIEYNIYSSSVAYFDPPAGDLVATTPDLTWSTPVDPGDSERYWRVTAVLPGSLVTRTTGVADRYQRPVRSDCGDR
ncbi:right-handed parallel beta-helix repeat-containing protein [bacterium]|nr:right-handed parallel beta-helix repeat-containing protein [bacterium]